MAARSRRPGVIADCNASSSSMETGPLACAARRQSSVCHPSGAVTPVWDGGREKGSPETGIRDRERGK
jgi:hypothetical protein